MPIYSSPVSTDSKQRPPVHVRQKKGKLFWKGKQHPVTLSEASASLEVKWRVPLTTGPAELAFPEGQAEFVTYISLHIH